MKAKVVKDAVVLVPNPKHKNFTRSTEIIKAGTEIEGTPKVIQGLKRGEPFKYRLFYTNDNKIIFIKNTDKMETTDVKLGADASQTDTLIKMPNESNFGKKPIIGTIAGLAIGYGVAKWRKAEGKNKWFFILGFGAAGFIAGKYLQSKTSVKIKPSK